MVSIQAIADTLHVRYFATLNIPLCGIAATNTRHNVSGGVGKQGCQNAEQRASYDTCKEATEDTEPKIWMIERIEDKDIKSARGEVILTINVREH